MWGKFYLISICCFLIASQGSAGDWIPDVEESLLGGDDFSATSTTETPNPSEKTTTTEASTTAKPTTPTTTPKSTTSPTPTTPTTTASTTPESPTTTTPKTTTSATPKTTTSATPKTTATPTTPIPPTNTTTMPPTTTVAPPTPPPLPKPVTGNWKLMNSTTNLTCVVLKMALRMNISYISSVNKTQKWGLVNLDKSANISGTCDDESIKKNVSQVRLSWDNNTNYLEIVFMRYNSSNSFNITHLYLAQNVSGAAFPNNTMKGMMHYSSNGSGLFAVEAVPVGSSYRCSSVAKVYLAADDSADGNASSAVLRFSDVRIQAFVNNTSGEFGTIYDCPGMDASDIVPIAVGCALAGLVIGVLIAYLVGRRRSHTRGYLSM